MSTASNSTVPSCSAHVGAGQYSATAQAAYNPVSWPYFKTYVLSAQVLPGLIIGALCWIGAIVFIIWLLTLCCRSVRWRARRARTLDFDDKKKNKQAGFNLILTIVTLGVIGAGTWALVTGIKATDGQVNDVWDLISVVRQKLVGLDSDIQSTSSALGDLSTSVQATYNLVDNNQAVASAAGINVPQTLSILQSLNGQIESGQSGTEEAQGNIGDTGINQINNLETNYKKKTTDAWKTYRVIAVAVFFGFLIFFGIITGFLAVLDRTPRVTAVVTLLLLIWTGLVILFGTGALNVVWRVTRDTCLYGISYASVKLGGGGNTQNILNYYFQKTYIAPQDVSQQLFGFNLTSTTATLNDSTIQSLVSELGTTQGQLLVATASANDQAAINALQPRMNSLSGNLTKLNNDILAPNFAPITNGIMALICCSITNALWTLWLASTITGALAGLLAVLAIVKVVTAVHPLDQNAHYTPHSPSKAPNGTNLALKKDNV